MTRIALAMTVLCLAALFGLRPGWFAHAHAQARTQAGLDEGRPGENAATLPGTVREVLGEPRIAGSGTLRWFGLRIYDATLWVGPEDLDPAEPTRQGFALELTYARSLSGASIAERSAEEIARMGFGEMDRRAQWLDAMRRLFPDVSDGDRILGVNRPGAATRFYLNGRPIGEVDDPAFGPAFFAIWLDPRTVAPGLRNALIDRP